MNRFSLNTKFAALAWAALAVCAPSSGFSSPLVCVAYAVPPITQIAAKTTVAYRQLGLITTRTDVLAVTVERNGPGTTEPRSVGSFFQLPGQANEYPHTMAGFDTWIPPATPVPFALAQPISWQMIGLFGEGNGRLRMELAGAGIRAVGLEYPLDRSPVSAARDELRSGDSIKLDLLHPPRWLEGKFDLLLAIGSIGDQAQLIERLPAFNSLTSASAGSAVRIWPAPAGLDVARLRADAKPFGFEVDEPTNKALALQLRRIAPPPVAAPPSHE